MQNKAGRQAPAAAAHTHQPLPVSLESFLVELLDSDDHPCAGPGRGEGVLVDPAFEDGAEASLAEDAVGAEVPGGGPQLVEGEAPHVGGLQNLALASRGCGIRIGHGQRVGDTAAPGTGMLRCAESQTSPAFRPPPRLAHCLLLLLLEPAAYASIIQNFRQAFDRSVCNNIDCYMMHACQEEIKQLSFLSACVCLYGQNYKERETTLVVLGRKLKDECRLE